MKREFTVIKRDGQIEAFDSSKVAKVAQAAGLRPIDAEEVAHAVVKWLEKREDSKVPSIAIRDTVFKELEKRDKYAAGLFAWYQSTKDKDTLTK